MERTVYTETLAAEIKTKIFPIISPLNGALLVITGSKIISIDPINPTISPVHLSKLNRSARKRYESNATIRGETTKSILAIDAVVKASPIGKITEFIHKNNEKRMTLYDFLVNRGFVAIKKGSIHNEAMRNRINVNERGGISSIAIFDSTGHAPPMIVIRSNIAAAFLRGLDNFNKTFSILHLKIDEDNRYLVEKSL